MYVVCMYVRHTYTRLAQSVEHSAGPRPEIIVYTITNITLSINKHNNIVPVDSNIEIATSVVFCLCRIIKIILSKF